MNALAHNTRLDRISVSDRVVFVKREDLCCPFPGPSFSKMRGVVAHIQNRSEKVIGVLDTYHSKAGWAVAYACKELGKHCVNFWPRYKADGPISNDGPPRFQQKQSKLLGAELLPLPAGRSSVLYHQARKILTQMYPDAYLMPNALKLPESITENASEARLAIRSNTILQGGGTLIISISSGTVAAGILRGFHQSMVLKQFDVVLHMGYSRSLTATKKYIEEKAGIDFDSHTRSWKIVDEGYSYADAAKGIEAPFPCNPYYDLKAWKWLSENLMGDGAAEPIVFWNIGD